MLISLNWIKDFVDIPKKSAQEIGIDLTLATAEVEKVIIPGEELKSIEIIEIKEVKPHPNADKLRLCSFNLKNGEKREVVCGAPNVRPGLKAAYAPMGTTLPNGLTLEPKKIRGIISEGMLCSEQELGLGDDHDGIIELPDSAELGSSLKSFLNDSES